MSKGDIALIDCKKGYSQSCNEELWSAMWCHWSGGQMPAIYNKIRERGLKPVFRSEDSSIYADILEELYETASSESFVRDALINEILTRLVTELLKETIYDEKPIGVSSGTERIDVGEIKAYIDTHYTDQLSLEFLADHFFFQKSYLARIFKETFGMSVGSYIQIVRIGRAKEYLRFSSMNIEEVGIASGYENTNYFSRRFKKVEGCSPSEFRKHWMSGKSVNE